MPAMAPTFDGEQKPRSPGCQSVVYRRAAAEGTDTTEAKTSRSRAIWRSEMFGSGSKAASINPGARP